MTDNYWSKIAASRLNRRQALQATAGAGLGAAFLAACGGGSDSGTSKTAGSQNSLTTQSEDTTKQAVRGGTLKQYISGDPQSLDPITPIFTLNFFAAYVYGTLINEEPGYLGPNKGVLTGDLAQSWEMSPDRLQITMKLRPGVKWHNKAPVNGRTVDVDDVLASWKRYSELSPVATLSVNSRNPSAPLLSATAADSSTVVFKLKEPLSYALHYLGAFGSFTGDLVMMPKEAGGAFDPRREMIGHGPFQLASVQPSVAYSFKRHPDYYDKDAALVDQIDVPVVIEYAQRLAQLKAGNIHRIVADSALSLDVVSTKREQPKLNIYQTDFAASGTAFIFGQLPAGRSVFRDERVRQAMSMGLDRDALIDASYNVSRLQQAGLPMETRWNSHMVSTWDGYWLDPQGKDFGPNAKYFKYDVAEAKKLIAAAGHPNGFKAKSNYTVDPRFNQSNTAQPIDGMLRDLGIDIQVNTLDYVNDYIPNYRDGQGQFEGWSYATILGTLPLVLHPVASPVAEYWPQGGIAFRGFSAGSSNDKSGDPSLNTMLEKARREFDDKALKSQLADIQRYLGKAMWGLIAPGGATGFNMAWPAVMNHRTWRRTRQGNASEWDPYKIWLDRTKAPFV
jgi:peptide/nickel transport system substrate-binding protein